jgi:hypothetical protein
MQPDTARTTRVPRLSEREAREAHRAGHLGTDAATALVLWAGLEELRSRQAPGAYPIHSCGRRTHVLATPRIRTRQAARR